MTSRSTSAWNLCLILVMAALWAPLALGAPHPGCGRLVKRSGHTLLGWKGLRAGINVRDFEKHPKTSGGGELGDVLYVADGTDLARSFAHTHVCEIYADSTAWQRMPKTWISQAHIRQGVHTRLFPGAVFFASHTAAGLHGDNRPWQLGVRGTDFHRLGIAAKCYSLHDSCVVPGLKLHYDKLSAPWNIHGQPERGR